MTFFAQAFRQLKLLVLAGQEKRRSDVAGSAFFLSTRLLFHTGHRLAKLSSCLPMAEMSSNSHAPTEMTTEDFKRQPETRSLQTSHPIWFHI